MRSLYFALLAFIVVLAFGFAGATPNDDPAPLEVAAAAFLKLPRAGVTSAQAASPQIMSGIREQAPLQFCGQCTSDSNCGTGHKCCGPSNCLECFKVVTCP